MTCLNNLNPNCNVALVLKRLQEEEEERKEYERRKAKKRLKNLKKETIIFKYLIITFSF